MMEVHRGERQWTNRRCESTKARTLCILGRPRGPWTTPLDESLVCCARHTASTRYKRDTHACSSSVCPAADTHARAGTCPRGGRAADAAAMLARAAGHREGVSSCRACIDSCQSSRWHAKQHVGPGAEGSQPADCTSRGASVPGDRSQQRTTGNVLQTLRVSVVPQAISLLRQDM